MSTSKADREYVSSVTLMILGEDLDPDKASNLLGMNPSSSWRRGESKKVGTNLHEWGGWKQVLPAHICELPFEGQLEYWSAELSNKSDAISQLRLEGNRCVLDCFITTGETASILLRCDLQERLAALSTEMQFSFWSGSNAC